MQARILLELPSSTPLDNVVETAAACLHTHGTATFTQLELAITLATSVPGVTAFVFTYTV
ncbi:hypothetical protein [Rhodococcus globerulus]|uniref:hypothetical protein n=1 Tax=Rhodococcus globerulus TaxID=33008 RepID=UPI00301AF91F